MNTHRVFSRNYGSTRAIPIRKLIAEAISDPALPEVWTSHKPGMQGGYDLSETQVACAEEQYFAARDAAIAAAKAMLDLGIAKQNANRLLMPFTHVTGIITASEWQNFFDLRCHPDADPTMRALAEAMRDAISESTPIFGPVSNDFHLPYVTDADWDDLPEVMSGDETFKHLALISAARCARVSYLNHDGSNPDIEKDLALARKLLDAKHMSPFEHQAQAWTDGVYKGHLSGNFRQWYQHRKMIEVIA